jgi:tyrosyl-tRNA synthetase
MEEINAMAAWQGAELNRAKEILAYEVTKTVHGKEEAEKALDASKALFAGGPGGNTASMPCTEIGAEELEKGINIIDLLEKAGLIPSRSEGRRLIAQGGLKLNEVKIGSADYMFTAKDLKDGAAMLQKGKKVYHRIQILDI